MRYGKNLWLDLLTFLVLAGGLQGACLPVYGDLISMAKGPLEGRILENSAQVLVLETVAGEYVVLQKDQINSWQKEPEPEFYFRRGRFFENKGDENRAILDYLETLNLNPNHDNAKKQIQTIQYHQKERQWNAGVEKGEQLLAEQEYKKALGEFQRVLEMEPEESLARQVIRKMSDTHARIAYLYYNHGHDEVAILELAKAEELNPNSAEIYYILGRIHESDRKFDQARLEFERALEIDPNHTSARDHLNDLIERTQSRGFRSS